MPVLVPAVSDSGAAREQLAQAIAVQIGAGQADAQGLGGVGALEAGHGAADVHATAAGHQAAIEEVDRACVGRGGVVVGRGHQQVGPPVAVDVTGQRHGGAQQPLARAAGPVGDPVGVGAQGRGARQIRPEQDVDRAGVGARAVVVGRAHNHVVEAVAVDVVRGQSRAGLVAHALAAQADADVREQPRGAGPVQQPGQARVQILVAHQQVGEAVGVQVARGQDAAGVAPVARASPAGVEAEGGDGGGGGAVARLVVPGRGPVREATAAGPGQPVAAGALGADHRSRAAIHRGQPEADIVQQDDGLGGVLEHLDLEAAFAPGAWVLRAVPLHAEHAVWVLAVGLGVDRGPMEIVPEGRHPRPGVAASGADPCVGRGGAVEEQGAVRADPGLLVADAVPLHRERKRDGRQLIVAQAVADARAEVEPPVGGTVRFGGVGEEQAAAIGPAGDGGGRRREQRQEDQEGTAQHGETIAGPTGVGASCANRDERVCADWTAHYTE